MNPGTGNLAPPNERPTSSCQQGSYRMDTCVVSWRIYCHAQTPDWHLAHSDFHWDAPVHSFFLQSAAAVANPAARIYTYAHSAMAGRLWQLRPHMDRWCLPLGTRGDIGRSNTLERAIHD